MILPSHSSARRLYAASLLALAAAPLGASTILLSENFAADSRTTENLPTTAGWYGVDGTISQPSAGSIQFTHVGTSNHVFGHFTSSVNGARTLALNETITASFDFQLTKANNASSSIRIGLLNSNGTRLTADGVLSNAAFSDDRGYGLFLNPVSTATSNLSLRARDASSTSLFNAGTPWTSNFGASTDGAFSATATETYSVSISVQRTGALNSNDQEVVTITGIISGGDLTGPISVTQSSTSVANTFFSFDTLGIGLVGSATTGTELDPAIFTLSNVNVSVSAIPEPSAFALLAGFVTLGCAATRRRRR